MELLSNELHRRAPGDVTIVTHMDTGGAVRLGAERSPLDSVSMRARGQRVHGCRALAPGSAGRPGIRTPQWSCTCISLVRCSALVALRWWCSHRCPGLLAATVLYAERIDALATQD